MEGQEVRWRLIKFTGKERDQELGLDYFGARYHGSAVGRFTSPDWSAKPVAIPYAKLENPQSLNIYAYMLDNPLRGVDPDGHGDHCKAGTPGCINGVQRVTTGDKMENTDANRKAADANPASVQLESSTGTAFGGTVNYELTGTDKWKDYQIVQAESTKARAGSDRVPEPGGAKPSPFLATEPAHIH